MSIHYLMKLEMLIMQVLQLHCQRKKLQISPPPQPWPPNVPDLNPVEWDYCKRRCTKHVSYHWSGRTETATEMEWPRWIMSSLRQPFVSGVADSSRSEMRVLYTFCRNNPHTLLSNGFKSGECGGHCWGGINSGFSNCNNAMVARAQWAFQVLQGSVKTLFRWGGKRYISFCSNLIQQTIYQISSELPEFYRRYYKKNVLVYFSGQCTVLNVCTMWMYFRHDGRKHWRFSTLDFGYDIRREPAGFPVFSRSRPFQQTYRWNHVHWQYMFARCCTHNVQCDRWTVTVVLWLLSNNYKRRINL